MSINIVLGYKGISNKLLELKFSRTVQNLDLQRNKYFCLINMKFVIKKMLFKYKCIKKSFVLIYVNVKKSFVLIYVNV